MADILKSAEVGYWEQQPSELCNLCRFYRVAGPSECPQLNGELACNELDEINPVRKNESHYFPKIKDILIKL